MASATTSDEDSSTEMPLLQTRQCARVCVRIYRADGLPALDSGILACVKKQCSVDPCRLLDLYVRVSFAGIEGCTSKCRRSPSPEWNEQLVFSHPFPLPHDGPLVLQVRDHDFVAGGVLGTSLVPIEQISDPGDEGFLPTFGPCFVYLHDKDDSDPLYKGRLLIAIHTEVTSECDFTKPFVANESIPPLPQGSYGSDQEFLLFACAQEASMIPRRVGERGDVRFTLQLGEIGRDPKEMGEGSDCCTPSFQAVSTNREYMHVPFGENLPCMWLKGKWPDNRKRMYASNVLHKMVKKLKECLRTIEKPGNAKVPVDMENNTKCLTDLEEASKKYLKVLKECSEPYAGMTQLDNERAKIFECDIASIMRVAAVAKTAPNKTMLESALQKLRKLKSKLKTMARNLYDISALCPTRFTNTSLVRDFEAHQMVPFLCNRWILDADYKRLTKPCYFYDRHP
ncbi:hypothetical protein JTE90_014274 [Oedothorax gibbosus]|uniref:C2 domain-containing protein n=1 Tax=Oedothorax gibbosus TaxID=931172 RepID=A0AAV6U145_9ARAC|nr:hypothetical protein JTE90_014274 [Oedothorax gibbosus]